METLAFILSIFGTICICVPPLLKGKKMGLILIFIFLTNILLAASYLLTGAFNGMASCLVGATTTIINYFFDRKNKPLPVWLVALYAIAFITVNLFAFERIIDLVALLASLTFVMCIGQKSGAKYRIWTFINTSLWIVYDLICHSPGPLTTHLFQISTIIFGIIIHDIKKKKS